MKNETYSNSRTEVYDAAIRSIKDLGWFTISTDRDAGLIRARTGTTLRSWGENISVRVSEEAGETTISVSSVPSSQVFNWGKDEENERVFLRKTNKIIER